jgi:hypothetical protein
MAPNRSSAPDRGTVEAVEHLCHALDRVGDALVTVDGDALLAAEVDLGAAAAGFTVSVDDGDRRALLDAVRRTRAALLRCRRLGASFTGVSRALNQVGRDIDGYDRAGGYVERGRARSSVQARV